MSAPLQAHYGIYRTPDKQSQALDDTLVINHHCFVCRLIWKIYAVPVSS